MQTSACYAVQVAEPDDAHSSPVFRNPTSPDKLIANYETPIHSVYDLFHRSALKYADRKCLGKQISLEESTIYTWLSYEEVDKKVNQAARILKETGLISQEQRYVAVVAPLSCEWLIFDLAINLLGAISVPINTRLPPPHLASLIKDSAQSIVGANEELIKVLEGGIDFKDYKVLTLNPASQTLIQKSGNHAQIIDYAEECKKYSDEPMEYVQDIDSIATIAFTSGTTQTPRGTLISNRNLVSARAALEHMKQLQATQKQKTYLLYLPVVHIMGRSSVYSNFACGAAIGISGGGLPHRVMEDLQILKPNQLFAVPRTLGKIYFKFKSIIEEQKPQLKQLVADALKSGICTQEVKEIFTKMKLSLGGNIQRILTGSATILPEVVHFLRSVLECEIVVGYGLAECAGVAFYTPKGDMSLGHVGSPLTSIQFKLVDVPDLEYYVSDKPFPRGQIWIRGNSVFEEYFKNEKEAEAKFEQGWLKTGDIGTLIDGNALQIIDRKDNLFKLQQGIFIAPERLEQIYSNCSLVQDIFVYGDNLRRHLVAIIVPDTEKTKEMEPKYLTRELEIQLETVANQFNLLNIEKLKKNFLLQHKPFIACGLLTPTMKLKRRMAVKHFAEQIDIIYSTASESEQKQ